jgi:tetratricopeptide (TPR) repeat protein
MLFFFNHRGVWEGESGYIWGVYPPNKEIGLKIKFADNPKFKPILIMIAEAIVAFVADKIAGQIIEDNLKHISHKVIPRADYNSRLYKCIVETIEDYERTNPTTKCTENKFPFYHSQLLFDLLSRYILFENGSAELFEEQFEQNPNIVKPSVEELNSFYTLFLEKVNADEVLKAKFIEENYKEKIFSNASKLDRVLHKLDAIKGDTEEILSKLSKPTLQPNLSIELTAQLPLLSSEKIVRRDKDLEDIRGRLVANKQVVLVNGMGGIGKTTLAQMYMTHYRDCYKHFAWITTGSGDFLTDLIQAAGLKESLHIQTTEGKTPHDYFNEIIIALKRINHKDNEQSLIVIDNTEENILQYYDYLPHPPHWHILATSRHKLEAFDVKELDFLTENQAIDLFKFYYKRSKISDDEIGKIVKALEYHTLTIEILAKTAHHDGLNVQQTVSAIAENYPVEVDARHASGKKIDRVTSYLSSIFNLSKLGDEEVWLLTQFYYLPSQYHSYATIETILLDAITEKGIKLQKVLSNLVAKGWLLYNEAIEEYKLHRIIGDVVNHSIEISFEGVLPIVKSISSLLKMDQTKDNPVEKFQWIIFGSHLLKLLSALEDSDIVKLQNNLATVLQFLGDYEGAKRLLKEATTSSEKNFGTKHYRTAACYSNLALVLQALGDYEGAKALLEKAIISNEKNFGAEHPTTAITYSNLAAILQKLSDYKGAKKLLEKAIISDEKNFGPEHPSTAIRYSNLATVLQDLGDYEGAKGLLERVKTSFEKNFGTHHPSTAVSYSNLATVLKDLGDYKEAKKLLEQAVISDEKNFGPEHPSTTVRYSNLASVLQDLGDYQGAKKLLEKAVISDEKNFGPEHPSTAVRYSNLALVLQCLGDYKEAKKLLEKAVISDEKNFGPEHPSTAVRYSNLASVLQDLGDYQGAKKLLEKAVISDEKNFGPEHPSTAVRYSNLASILQDLGDYEGARELLEKATTSDEKNLGTDHPSTAGRYSNLASVLQDLGDYEGAKRLLEKAIRVLEKTLGCEHPNTLTAKQNLDYIVKEMGKQGLS